MLSPELSRRNNRFGLLLFAIFVALFVGAFTLFSPRTPVSLSDRDTMVVADFTNGTGETVFDGALKVAPVGPPSVVARPPLSDVKMTSVLSVSLRSSSFFRTRPTASSMLSTIAA